MSIFFLKTISSYSDSFTMEVDLPNRASVCLFRSMSNSMILGNKGPRLVSPRSRGLPNSPLGSLDCGGIRDSPTHHSAMGPGVGVMRLLGGR